MFTSRRAAWITVVIGSIALIVSVVALWKPADGGVSVSGTGNSVGNTSNVNVSVGTSGCVAINGSCVINEKEKDPNEAIRKLQSLPGATDAPSGDAPWTFMVLGTQEMKGLYVRDSYRVEGQNKGSFLEGRPVYVDCQITDGFNADPETNAGGRWYKVRYPNAADQGSYWSYAGYLYPVGHNGDVPLCQVER